MQFSVNHWGSHPDDGNDDCWTGEDFATFDEAFAAYQAKAAHDVAYIELDSGHHYMVRPNPDFRSRRAEEDLADWKREIAMEAGMAFGCDGYNDAMGY